MQNMSEKEILSFDLHSLNDNFIERLESAIDDEMLVKFMNSGIESALFHLGLVEGYIVFTPYHRELDYSGYPQNEVPLQKSKLLMKLTTIYTVINGKEIPITWKSNARISKCEINTNIGWKLHVSIVRDKNIFEKNLITFLKILCDQTFNFRFKFLRLNQFHRSQPHKQIVIYISGWCEHSAISNAIERLSRLIYKEFSDNLVSADNASPDNFDIRINEYVYCRNDAIMAEFEKKNGCVQGAVYIPTSVIRSLKNQYNDIITHNPGGAQAQLPKNLSTPSIFTEQENSKISKDFSDEYYESSIKEGSSDSSLEDSSSISNSSKSLFCCKC